MGVSVRRLNGWEPADVTTFEYDGDRLVRTVTVREPEFPDSEKALLLASRRYAGELNEFGVPVVEAMDPANQFAWEGQEKPRTDWMVKAAHDRSDTYYKANPQANRNGHRWGPPKRRDVQGD